MRCDAGANWGVQLQRSTRILLEGQGDAAAGADIVVKVKVEKCSSSTLSSCQFLCP